MSTQPLPPNPEPVIANDAVEAVSLEDVLQFFATQGTTNAAIYDLVYEKVSVQRFQQLVTRAQRVQEATRPADGSISAAAWRARQNTLRGTIFEQIVGLFLRASRPFQSYNRLQTPTNEIDWLVVFGPLQITIRAFGEWGTHFICECKFTQENVKSEWVGKLATLLDTHGARVAVLIAHKVLQGSKGAGRQAQRLAQDLSIMANPKYILSLSFDDLEDCARHHQNFLHLLNIRYVELRARVNRLKLIIN